MPWSIARITVGVNRSTCAPCRRRATRDRYVRTKCGELAPAVEEARAASRAGRTVLEVELDLLQPAAGAQPRRRSSPSPSRTRSANGSSALEQLAAQRALAGDRRVGSRARSGSRIAQRAKPTAMPKPPPSRRAKAATARSHSPRLDRVDQRRQPAPADAPRSPSQSRTTVSARPAAIAARAGARGGRRRAALAPAPPRRRHDLGARPARRAPRWRRASRSSASTSARPGSAARSASSVAAIRSASSRAATITTRCRSMAGFGIRHGRVFCAAAHPATPTGRSTWLRSRRT